ncbi:MAG: PDZ domain-containing protein, partial [Myxococcales bacterium]|nr:PDZ domain-containing protein [Myxococcales bacterium]
LVPGAGATLRDCVAGRNESGRVRSALAAIGLSLVCATSARVAAGFFAERDGDGLRVVTVAEGGAADLAGLKPGDRIVTLDGAPPAARWPDEIAHAARGDTLLLRVVRAQRSLALHVTLQDEQETACKLTQTSATPSLTKLREQLLAP